MVFGTKYFMKFRVYIFQALSSYTNQTYQMTIYINQDIIILWCCIIQTKLFLYSTNQIMAVTLIICLHNAAIPKPGLKYAIYLIGNIFNDDSMAITDKQKIYLIRLFDVNCRSIILYVYWINLIGHDRLPKMRFAVWCGYPLCGYGSVWLAVFTNTTLGWLK